VVGVVTPPPTLEGPGVPGVLGAGPGDFGAGAGLDVHFDPKSGHATLEKYTPRTAPTIAKTQHIPMTTMILALTIVNIVGFFSEKAILFQNWDNFSRGAYEGTGTQIYESGNDPASTSTSLYLHRLSLYL
jgi:hypothetical protein